MFQAIHHSKHTNDTEDADSYTKQRKKCPELVLPQFLQRHFKTAHDNFYGAANHVANLPEAL
jgi:hypothetical protein